MRLFVSELKNAALDNEERVKIEKLVKEWV